jgi:Golgi SNAP receptor complex protein 1
MKIDNHNNHNHNNNNNNDTILESLRQRKKGEGGGASASSSSPPSTTPTTTTTSMEDFDSLKRQATKLERHLEEQVARYQQLAQQQATTLTANNNNNTTDAELGMTTTVTMMQEELVLARDISRNVQTLGDLISQQLSPAAVRSGKAQHSLLVKRYREILFDVTSDFQKTTAALQRQREYSELMTVQNVHTTSTATSSTNDDGGQEALLLWREQNSIQNSVNATSSILQQAGDTFSSLQQQGASLRGVGGSISRITQAVPSLHRLMDAIRRKKSRDDYIVAAVIATCIVFTLWYVFG